MCEDGSIVVFGDVLVGEIERIDEVEDVFVGQRVRVSVGLGVRYSLQVCLGNAGKDDGIFWVGFEDICGGVSFRGVFYVYWGREGSFRFLGDFRFRGGYVFVGTSGVVVVFLFVGCVGF